MTDPTNSILSSHVERLQQLEQTVADTQAALRLQAEQMERVLNLVSRMTPPSAPTTEEIRSIPDPLESPVSRRSMLKKAALATLGAAAVLETMPSARAANASNVVLGETNSATTATTITSTAPTSPTANASTLFVQNTNTSSTYTGIAISASSMYGSAIYATASTASAIYANSSGSDGIQTVSGTASGIFAMTQSTASGSFAAIAVAGSGSAFGGDGGQYGADLQGGVAPLHLASSTTLTTPLANSTTHTQGELFVDKSGGLWYCVAGGSPGTWNRLATTAPASSVNAGNFALLSAPTRYIDTRPTSSSYTETARPAPGGGVTTYIFSGTSAMAAYAPASTTAPVIPFGATGLVGRITVLNGQDNHATSSGQLKVSNANPPGFGSGLIIWDDTAATQILPFVLALDNSSGKSGKMYFVNTSASDVIDIVVDVTGYYY